MIVNGCGLDHSSHSLRLDVEETGKKVGQPTILGKFVVGENHDYGTTRGTG